MLRKLQVILLVFISLLTVNPSRAASKAQCPTLNKLAQELLKLELSGQRYPEFDNSCVSKLKSESILVRHGFVDDSSYKAPANPKFVSRKDLTITGVEKTDFPDRFRVSFSVKRGIEKVEDSFVMETFSGELRSMAGCAAIAEPPKEFWLFSGCEKK